MIIKVCYMICVAVYIQCHFMILDEHFIAYKFLQTAEVPRFRQLSYLVFTFRPHPYLPGVPWPASYGDSLYIAPSLQSASREWIMTKNGPPKKRDPPPLP